MERFPVQAGQHTSFSKTVSEADVYLFAGITGDFAPNHVNEAEMQRSSYGRRIAHGALLIGFMSTASTLAVGQAARERAHDADGAVGGAGPGADRGETARGAGETAVSLGYDRVRFVGPVFLGDTITVDYTIASIDPERRRAVAEIKVTNQDDQLVAVASHVLKWVPNR